ncbi:MAG: 16S rRNA (cytosine(967)-C(5))-methyltransferase RsmB [Myxococcota bacterium]|nr:16S rRNA (cytosine(967)-C(5))-methyltransferase RsmB [Myxococcota bacterium]
MSERRNRPGGSRPRSASENTARRRGSGPTVARLAAVRVLERVERARAYADIALHHVLASSNMASVDRRLATELVYGTLRWRGRLDFVLGAALERKIESIEPLVLTTLRMGAYQLLFSDRIPDTAAVDESVRCIRALGAERATGLVNATLRRVSRERETFAFPQWEPDPIAHLVDALSLPRWLAERWLADYGTAAAPLAEASNAQPPHTIRANPQRGSREELLARLRPEFPEARACSVASRGLVLGRSGDAGRDPLFRKGDYTVQDEASQAVVDLLGVEAGHRVLDVCAAPGTKTTAIAELLAGSGSVLALDRHARRLGLVGQSARRLGLKGISTLARDATRPLDDLPWNDGGDPPPGYPCFDRVLVDAPCSGLGALRRNPDARWRVRPSDPARLGAIQSTLLGRAAAVVSPGGSLVYSTCTVIREENEEVVERFLEAHPGFRLTFPSEIPPALVPVIDSNGFMRFHPHVNDSDGFFAARFERIN